jgi:Ni/Fe-hydrogenase 1 B-type cytochrome subunit
MLKDAASLQQRDVEWVTASGEEHGKIANLKPGSKEDMDSEAYAEMHNFRKPFINTHVYVFYLLLVTIVIHVIAVVITEVREKMGLCLRCLREGKYFLRNHWI